MEPSGSINVTQQLFLMDEKLMNSNTKLLNAMENSKTVSEWNSIKGLKQGIGIQQPAYLNQARLSTYYQDNGSKDILQYSAQFGLSVMGGEYNNIGGGARPGNVLPANEVAKTGYALYNNNFTPVNQPGSLVDNVSLDCDNGVCLPKFMGKPRIKQTPY